VKLAPAPWLAAASALALAACSNHRPAGGTVVSGSGATQALPATSVEAAPPPFASIAPAASASASPPVEAATSGMGLVPAGAFVMGADNGGELDEHPAHTVTLPAFYLDLTEVTNEAYSRCVDAQVCPAPDAHSAAANGFGSDTHFRGPRQPVSSVGWDAARAYCAWLGKRLPTEAEWEKAARGTDGRTFPWGNEQPTPDRAVFGAGVVTGEVGTHPRGDGPYGHHDLAGNVWEWVEDIYDPYAYTRAGAASGVGGTCAEALDALADVRARGLKGFTGSNPVPVECEHVLRGGAFNYSGPGLRSTNRVHHPSRFHLVMAGFRCARDAP
jgi:formylglycine-generating enzyme required for sulfatase activity